MRQISELLHLPKKRVSIYRHLCGKLLSSGGLFFSKVVRSKLSLKGLGQGILEVRQRLDGLRAGLNQP